METHITNLVNDKVLKIKNGNNIFSSGKVIKIKDYIIEVSGLEDVMYFEKVIIMEKGMGYVNGIFENSVSVAIVKENEKIEMGDIVNSTGEIFKAVFSEDAIGRITDIFGVDQLSGKAFENFKYIDIERPNVPIMDRTAVCRPMLTGIAGIDLIYPIRKRAKTINYRR